MIKIRSHVILLDLRIETIAVDLATRSLEEVLVEAACAQIDGGDEVDDGAVAINAVVVIDDISTFSHHEQQYRAMVENELGTRFIILLLGVHDSMENDNAVILEYPPVLSLHRDVVRLLWVPFPIGTVWVPGDSKARGVGVNTSEVDDDFGAMAVMDAITIPEVFEALFVQSSNVNFGPLSVATRQAFFGRMSAEALADACREAGEILAGDRLQDPLVAPPKPWEVPRLIGGESEEFDPIQKSGGFGKFLLDSNEQAQSVRIDLGIGRRRGWFRRCIAAPVEHISKVQALGVRYDECGTRVVDLFESVDPTDGFDINEFAKLRDEGIDLYPGRGLAADPVDYARQALEPILNDLRSGHSIASLAGYLRHQSNPIAPRPRQETREELDSAIDVELSQRLTNCGATYPNNLRRRLVRSTLRMANSEIGRWVAGIVIVLLVGIAVANWLIGDSSTTSSGLVVRFLGWERWPAVILISLGVILGLLLLVAVLIWVVDRQLARWAVSSGVEDIYTGLQRLIRTIRRIAVNDWALYRLRVETMNRIDALLEILESTSVRILDVLTQPSQQDLAGHASTGGVNQEIRVDFNEGRDVGIYRNFSEVVGIIRSDALSLIEQAFTLYFDQLKGGQRVRDQVADLIAADLDQSLTGLVDVTISEGIIIKSPRRLAGGRKIINEEGVQRREKLVKDIWADEGIIRETVAESVFVGPSEPLMHFVHPQDLRVVDASGDSEVNLRFAPVASRPSLSAVSPPSPFFSEIVFTEQTALAGILRLVPFRVGTFQEARG